MLPRSSRKRKRLKNWAEKQYERHLRHNTHFAKPGPHEFIIILDHLKPSFNVGKIFRSADAFGAKEVHLIGIDSFLTQSAKGAFKYVPAVFHTSFEACYERLKDEYSFFILEPGAEEKLTGSTFPEKSAFIFGNEEVGISFDAATYPEIHSLSIPQFGKVESLNVSIAASIVMYEYLRQNKV